MPTAQEFVDQILADNPNPGKDMKTVTDLIKPYDYLPAGLQLEMIELLRKS